ncbi:MAG: von Willebrand factor type A domain-containing protein [Bacteroidia bacterium]|nr:von Willebrand factor type A domain-containing protein [Bacteroidia bacterium]
MKTINSSLFQRQSFILAQCKFLALLTVFLFLIKPLAAQTKNQGCIKVLLVDKSTQEAIPFANVVVYLKGVQKGVATTNIDGEAIIKALAPGKYKVKGVYVGYQVTEIKDVVVDSGKTAYVKLSLNASEGISLQEVEVVTYMVPLIEPDTKSGQTVTREDYQNLATKDINSVAATSGRIHKLRGGRAKAEERLVEEYRYPGEQYESSPENTFKKCKKDPLSTFSSDVDVASYANIRRMLSEGQLPPKEAVRIEEMVNYFRYQYPAPENQDAFSIHSEISTCPWNTKHRLLQIGVQGRSVEFSNTQANHLTFLIDVSGSMQSPDKLPLLKDGLSLLVKQLRENDKVAIVVYAGNAGLVLPSTGGDQKEKILGAIAQLEAGGSTAGGQGIELAYTIAKENYSKRANNRVILATDGDFNVGISDDASLVKLIEEKREQGIFLTVLGFGTGNYQDAKMEKLADKGNGNYAYVDNLLEAKKVLVKEIGGTLITIAKDVKIQIEFNPKHVKSYRLIGYDNRMLAHEDFKNDKKDAGDVGSGHSVTALYEIVPANNKEDEDEVDDYKYQNNQNSSAAESNEICTVKLRYKEPKESVSKEISQVVKDENQSFENSSENFRFCAAVAQFGLILRQSEFKGEAKYSDIIQVAKSAKGKDEDGYRAEFIRMCEMADALASR